MDHFSAENAMLALAALNAAAMTVVLNRLFTINSSISICISISSLPRESIIVPLRTNILLYLEQNVKPLKFFVSCDEDFSSWHLA
jgi:hypothetical protein